MGITVDDRNSEWTLHSALRYVGANYGGTAAYQILSLALKQVVAEQMPLYTMTVWISPELKMKLSKSSRSLKDHLRPGLHQAE